MNKKSLNFNNIQFVGNNQPDNENQVAGNPPEMQEDQQAKPTGMGRFVKGTGDKTTVFGVPYGIFKRLRPEHKQYYYEKALKDEKLAQANDIEARANKNSEVAYNRLEQEQEDSRKENPILSALSAGAGEMAGFTTPYQAVADPDIAAASAAINKVNEAREVIDNSNRKDNTSTVGEIGRGFVNKAKKLSTWDFGATDVSDNKALLEAAKKKQNGDETSPAEDNLLEAAALNSATHADYDKDTSMSYRIGEGTAQTISYMKDFLLTGGMQGLGEAAVEKFGVNAATKTLGQVAKNAALRAGGDLVGTIGMAGTVHAGQTAADALDRMTGKVVPTFDKDGNAQFDKTEGGEDGGTALGKAFGNTVTQDYSEMFGEYFSPINKFLGNTAGKVADKIGLQKVHDAIATIPASQWGKTYQDFTKQTHWNGFVGEYGEELVGTAMNAAFVGDNKFSDLIDPQQQKETFLSVALMSGLMGGVNVAGYRTPKYLANQNLKVANQEAYSQFGDSWDQLKQQFDNADDKEQVSILNNVLSNKDYSPEKKNAFSEYAARLQAYHGTNIADAKRKMEGDVPEEQLQLENSYDQGTTLVDPADRKAAKDEYEAIRSSIPQDQLPELESSQDSLDYFGKKLHQESNDKTVPAADSDTVEKFFNAKAKYEGMIDGIRDNIDSQVQEANQTISDRTHDDGNIYEVRLKTDDNTPYYIVKGNVSFDPETNIPDTNNSDDKVILRNADGKLEMRPSSDIGQLSSQDNAEQLKTATAQAIWDQESNKAANEIDGVRDFAQDETVTINTPEGLKEVVVNGITPEGNYEVVSTDNSPIVNGEVATVLDKKQLSQMENEAKQVQAQQQDQSGESNGMVQQDNAETVTPSGVDTNTEVETPSQPSNATAVTDSNVSDNKTKNDGVPGAEHNNLPNNEQVQPYNQETNVPDKEQPSNAISQDTKQEEIPTDEEGEPIFHQMPIEKSASLLSELDKEDQDQIVENNINSLSKEVDKLSKMKPKSTSFNKIKAEREEIKGRLAEAQTKLDYWNKLKEEVNKPAAPVTPAMDISKGGLEARKEETAKVVEDNNSKLSAIKQKFESAPKVEGLQDEIVLANGEKMPGHYILTEADAVTPSHNPEAGYTKSEGFPVDENGRTVNDRDYENDKQAQLQVEQKAQNYDSRAIQNPVIVSNDGVVYSGNDRTMAGQIAAKNGTDHAYKEYTRKHGKKFGFTPEQVDSFKNPRVLFVPDEKLPYNAETFAKFNADDKKTQNKTEQAVKAGKVINEQTVSKASTILDGFESLPEFYSNPQATKEMLHLLLNDGIIGQNEVAEMMDGNTFSSVGRDYIENALIGSVLDESAVRKVMQMKDLRQVIVKSLTQIIKNKKCGEFSFENEITDAINLLYDAKKAGVKTGQTIDDYMRQGNLFGENALDLYGATVQMLANALNKGPLFFKRTLSVYNNQAEQAASGQTDLFKGDVRNKEDIINDVLNFLGYEQGTRTTESTEQPEGERPENETGNVTPGNEETGTTKPTGESGSTGGTETEGLNQHEKEAIAEVDALTKGKSKEHAEIDKEAEKVNTNPSEAQKEAGNYKMGHIKVQGFDITLENPQGSERSGVDGEGKPWSITMNNHYGYFRGTEGKDGDHIDTFLGNNLKSDKVFVVDQVNKDGSFDEHKVMLGFDTLEEAKKAYLSNYEDGWQGLGNITETTVDKFRKWADTDTRKVKPFADYKEVKESSTPELSQEQKDAISFVSGKKYEPETDKSTTKDTPQTKNTNKNSTSEDNTNNLIPEKTVDKPIEIETDAVKIQEIKNAIAEGEQILKSGKKVSGDAYSQGDLKAIRRQVEKDKKRIGIVDHNFEDDLDRTKQGKAVHLENNQPQNYPDQQRTNHADVDLGLADKSVTQGSFEADTNVEQNNENNNNDDIRLRNGETVLSDNERFNNELQQQIDNTLPKSHIYQLGKPSDILISAGIPDLPIELASKRLERKSNQDNHIFELKDITNLPNAIQNPIAVFNSKTHIGSKVILTELSNGEKNYIVAIKAVNKLVSGERRLEVNEIKSLYPKDTKQIVKWISQDNLLNWVNKEKADKFLNIPQSNSEDDTQASNSLSSATKIIQNFENPTVKDGEIVSNIEDLTDQLNTNVKIVRSLDEITDANKENEKLKRNSKGWFDPKTGEVVVVLPNAESVEDAKRTVLHEVVAHKGLRGMFGEKFDSFLGQVYDNATPEIRKKINSLAVKHGWNINVATEESLASLAEKGFEDKQEQTLWGKIKQAFMDMVHKAKINLGYKINDADLRYILWKSYQKLNNDSPLFKNAADAAMKDKLFKETSSSKQSSIQSEANNDNVLFRSKEEPVTPENLIQTYDDKFKKKFMGINVHKFKEAYQDSMLALKDLQELIAKSTGKEIKDHENAYIAENQLSSKGAAESEFYKDNYFKPMINAVNDLMKNGKTYKEIIDYMVAKHGLERNEVMAKRDADKWTSDAIETANKMAIDGKIDSDQLHEMLDAISIQAEEKYNKYRQNDYSGLTQLTGSEDQFERLAQDMVDEFETDNEDEVIKLWDKINIATKQTLLKSYTSGLMSKSTYEKVRDMFKYYVPLRGWDDNIASDVYDYILSERSPFNAPVKSAKGRSSLADDPIAVIANMADSAILQGNRNLMKQKFLNMILNHPNDLATVKDMWYENRGTDENPIWAESFPDIKPDATPDDVNTAIEEHEERMKELESKGMAKKTRNGLNVGYRTNAKERNEHIVIVKRGGKEQAIYINGNPRAAQAINGFTNPDATDHKLIKTIQWINRQMAANFTTRNPAFVLTNMSRDLIFSTTAIDVKENSKYSMRFKKNVAKNIAQIVPLMSRLHSGSLDLNRESDRLFNEFIINGGETGYTALKSVDDYKNIVANELLKAKGKTDLGSIIGLEVGKITTPTTLGVVPALHALSKWTEFGNRCAEDISRFSTYMTSRQMGRSVLQSINDAKEVTVNFNKKGAGGYMGATTMKSLYLFFNAAVQSLNNLCKLAKKSPVKFSGAIGSFTAAGLLIPLMNNLLMAAIGGDDDKDAYNNLPDWVRKNNVCFYVGNKKFVTIPLPIELRAFYGLGEMAYQYSAGNMDHKNIGVEMINQFSALAPLDPTGGSNSLVPDAAKPIAQVLENKDFYDKPIYKKFDYNDLMPEYTKAYAGTSNWLIKSAEFLNNETGGNPYKPGKADINPAIVEHLFEGYFGGMAKTANQTAKTIDMIWNDDERMVRNVPVVNRFVSSASDEKNAYSRVNEEYFNYKKEYDLTKQQVNGFNKEEKHGIFDYAKQVDFLHNSSEFKRYEIFKDHEKTIKSIQDDIKSSTGEDKKNLEKMLNLEKIQLIEQMKETE